MLTMMLTPLSAAAGDEKYKFTVRSEGDSASIQHGEIVSGDSCWFIAFDPLMSTHTQAVLGHADGRRIGLNHSLRTWFELRRDEPNVPVRSLLDFYRMYPSRYVRVRTEFQRTAPENTSSIAFRYGADTSLAGESVASDVTLEVTLEPKHGIGTAKPLQLLYGLKTQIDSVDGKIASLLSSPVEPYGAIRIAASRRFRGGKWMRQKIDIELVRSFATEASIDCVIPSSFRHQEPVLAAPSALKK